MTFKDHFSVTATGGREPEDRGTTVLRGSLPSHQAASPKPGEHPAQVPGIELQRPREPCGREPVPVRELVEHPDLPEAEVASQVLLVQQPEAAGIRPVESTHCVHRVVRNGHGCMQQRNDCLSQSSPCHEC